MRRFELFWKKAAYLLRDQDMRQRIPFELTALDRVNHDSIDL